ncbi:MAG: hypothetical protein RLZZ338_2365 [Cyanobacteriota bacterium]
MIEVENLSKFYGSTPALQDVSFRVEKGEILGFLGPNGAGKTTTMRILSGYLPASSGIARVAGYEVHENSMEVRQRIGYLPENPPLYPEMTVAGFLDFVARIKKVPGRDRVERVQFAMEQCGLLEKRKVLIRKLSKGYRQRVGIAHAIVHDPPVIILDEPTVGLDPKQIIEVRNLIKSLAGQHTIILSTHILQEVSMTCNKVAIINRGRVVVSGTPDNLMAQLGSGASYELEIDTPLENFDFLYRVEGVSAIDILNIKDNDLPETRPRLRILWDSEREPGREVINALVSEGVGVYEMRRTRASLEEVFLKVISQQEDLLKASLLTTDSPVVSQNYQGETEANSEEDSSALGENALSQTETNPRQDAIALVENGDRENEVNPTVDSEALVENGDRQKEVNPRQDSIELGENALSQIEVNPTVDSETLVKNALSQIEVNPTVDSPALVKNALSEKEVNPTVDSEALVKNALSQNEVNPTVDSETLGENTLSQTEVNPTVDSEKLVENTLSQTEEKLKEERENAIAHFPLETPQQTPVTIDTKNKTNPPPTKST